MFVVYVALLVIVALAVLVTLFVAFPHRGEPIPYAAWLSRFMLQARDRLRPPRSAADLSRSEG